MYWVSTEKEYLCVPIYDQHYILPEKLCITKPHPCRLVSWYKSKQWSAVFLGRSKTQWCSIDISPTERRDEKNWAVWDVAGCSWPKALTWTCQQPASRDEKLTATVTEAVKREDTKWASWADELKGKLVNFFQQFQTFVLNVLNIMKCTNKCIIAHSNDYEPTHSNLATHSHWSNSRVSSVAELVVGKMIKRVVPGC